MYKKILTLTLLCCFAINSFCYADVIINVSTCGGSGLTWINKTADYTASAGEGILVNSDTGAIIVTLPSSPSIGDSVGIIDEDGNANTNNITIARNGSNIMGLAEDMTISTDNAAVILVYSADATQGWKIESATAAGVSYSTGITIGTGTKHDGYVIRDAAEVQTTDATQTTLDSITQKRKGVKSPLDCMSLLGLNTVF